MACPALLSTPHSVDNWARAWTDTATHPVQVMHDSHAFLMSVELALYWWSTTDCACTAVVN